MFERLSRSYHLMRHSWSLLVKDKELMVFPLLSGLGSLLTVGSFMVPVVTYVMHHNGQQIDVESTHLQAYWYGLMFLFYLLTFFITYYFNVAVMHCAAIRMDGGDPTVADGFRGANAHALRIFGWAAVSATVGLLLRALEERMGLLGRIVISLVGCAWAVVTYFAMPVLIFEQVGVGGAVKRSAELLKRSWGEAMVANAGVGMVFSYLSLLGFIPVGLGAWAAASGAPLIGVAVASGAVFYWLCLAIVSSALSSIFRVALYRYAATGQVPEGYPAELISTHFQPKPARRFFGR